MALVNLYAKLFIKILSVNVLEKCVILVGLFITGKYEKENKLSTKFWVARQDQH